MYLYPDDPSWRMSTSVATPYLTPPLSVQFFREV